MKPTKIVMGSRQSADSVRMGWCRTPRQDPTLTNQNPHARARAAPTPHDAAAHNYDIRFIDHWFAGLDEIE